MLRCVDTPFPLRTRRLTLRLHRPEDAPALLGYYADPEVTRYLLHGPWTDEDARAAACRRASRTGLDAPDRALALVVEHEGRVVGDVALWATDATGAVAEVGWVLHPAAAGRGLMTEAVEAVLELALGRYGVHRVVARMDARNTASARLCERVGMTHEATLRADWWSKGEWTDTGVHGLLASDRPPVDPEAIVVSAVTLRDREGRVLTVRKRGTDSFMQPGGKPEGGESPAACALREVEEELGLVLDPARLELVAVHRTAAANEAGRALLATVFEHPHLREVTAAQVTPEAEIEEVRWLDPREPLPADTAPLLRWLLTQRADAG